MNFPSSFSRNVRLSISSQTFIPMELSATPEQIAAGVKAYVDLRSISRRRPETRTLKRVVLA